MKKPKKNSYLKNKFIKISILTVILLLLVQGIFLFQLYLNTEKIVNNLTVEISQQVNTSTTRVFDYIKTTGMRILYGDISMKYLLASGDFMTYQTLQNLTRQIESVVEINSYIQGFAYFRADHKYTYHQNNANIDQLLLSQKVRLESKNLYAGFQYLVDPDDPDNSCVAYVQSVYCTSFKRNGEFLGTGVVLLNPDILNEIFMDKFNNNKPDLYLLDSQNKIICYNNPAIIKNDVKIDEIMKKSTSIVQEIGDTGLKVVCDVNMKSVLENYSFSTTYIIIVLVIIILLFVILIELLNRNIISPIQKLYKEIDLVNNHGLKARIHMPGGGEIGEIANTFNQLLDHQQELSYRMLHTQQNLYEAELTRNRNEILALETQVNPHFLLNALQCICGMAVVYDAPKIVEISTCMSNIFKYCLRQQDVVTVREEIENVRQYMKLIDIRFDYAFKWEINIPDELLGIPIIKMVLQPLVENAVYHGLEKNGKGNLWISGTVQNEAMLITVKDNGYGIEAHKLSELNAILNDPKRLELEVMKRKRIGIVNICRRLKLIYGEQFGLYLSANGTEGFQVECRIPVQQLK